MKVFTVYIHYFIVGQVDGYIEEINGNKYLVFAFIDENKKVIEK